MSRAGAGGRGGAQAQAQAAVRAAVRAQARDERFMRRALALAARGRGRVRPNPMVGAVIVSPRGRVLAEGFHRRVGEAHAEIDALARLPGRRAPGATLYVTLEPCCHVGRTGPCTEAVIASGVARVVVGVRDANPIVDGRGIGRLRRAGVRVDVGCLDDLCRAQNRAFFVWARERRPLVTLKAAATLDGFIADGQRRARRAPVWITGRQARAAAHALRAEHDAILVGAGTVRADDPRLTVRLAGAGAGAGRGAPLRVILDGRLSIPAGAAVLARRRGAPPALVVGAAGAPAARRRALEAAGAEVALLPARAGQVDPARLLALLASRDVQTLLVEGGAAVHAAFVASGLVDRVAFFFAPRLLGGGVPIAAPAARAPGLRLDTAGAGGARALGPLAVRRVGPDLLIEADVIGRGRGRR